MQIFADIRVKLGKHPHPRKKNIPKYISEMF